MTEISCDQNTLLFLDTVPDPDLKRSENEEIAGLVNWNRPHKRAYGLSTTLYECHPITCERAGEFLACGIYEFVFPSFLWDSDRVACY